MLMALSAIPSGRGRSISADVRATNRRLLRLRQKSAKL